jgi:ABC-type uncharacterized transport system substrate-binding protein
MEVPVMRRLGPIALLLGLLAASPAGAASPPRVGVLRVGTDEDARAAWHGFVAALDDAGFDRSAFVDRAVGDDRDEAASRIEEMRHEGVELIVAVGDAAAELAHTIVRDRHVVYAGVDPATTAGLVEGGGACVASIPDAARLLEDLRRAAPTLARVAVYVPEGDDAARENARWKATVQVVAADGVGATPDARAAAATRGLVADLVWLPPSVTNADAAAVAAALAGRGMPLVGSRSAHLRAGASMVLRADPDGVGAAAAGLMKRLLAGADPAKFPVLRPRRIVLDVDLAAAARLRCAAPFELLAWADSIVRPRGGGR